MKKIKVAFCCVFICLLCSSCGLSDLFSEYCPDDSKNLKGDINFGKYYSDVESGYPSEFIAVQEFIFLEDSSFLFVEIYKNEDTVKFLKGKFKTYIDSGFAWYVLKLSADTVYEKEMAINTGINRYLRHDEEGKFVGFYDSLLSNVDYKANCFSMAYKSNPSEWGSDLPSFGRECNKMILNETRTFCMKQNL